MNSNQTIIVDRETEDFIEALVGDDSSGKFTATGWYSLDKKTVEITDSISGVKIVGVSIANTINRGRGG